MRKKDEGHYMLSISKHCSQANWVRDAGSPFVLFLDRLDVSGQLGRVTTLLTRLS
jgi:hypothetical protein